MPQKPPLAEKSAPTFESAMLRLEEIVSQMEGDKLALEELLERYEEGSKLVKVCQEKLESAERRIEIITRNAAGKPQVAEFEPAESPLEPNPPSTPKSSTSTPAAASTPKPDRAGEVSLF